MSAAGPPQGPPREAGRSPGPKGASASEGAADGMPQRVSSKAAEARELPRSAKRGG
jgi:hypothetical protein